MVFVRSPSTITSCSSTDVKIDHIHYSICFLKQVQSSFILFSFNELVCGVIQLGHYDQGSRPCSLVVLCYNAG